MNRLPALAAIALLAAGCEVTEPASPPAAADSAPNRVEAPVVTRRAVEVPVLARLADADANPYGTTDAAERWSSYRDFWFDFGSARLDVGENSKVADVASYLRQNPSYRAAIDGATDPGDAGLGERRIDAIRVALVKAGIPEYKIRTGPFGDARFRRERRVEVLVLSQR